jgi:polyisoprenoid-binding protein YceI
MTWDIDYSHSSITFSVRHMVVAKVRGQFEKWNGTLKLDLDDLTKSTVAVKIDAASIDTREEKRDGHLRSPDFLDVEKFPTLDFKSKRVEKLAGNELRIVGDLTIVGQTHEVVLLAEFGGRAKSPWGTESAAFSAHTKIDRKAWGLEWNKALETGGFLVGETIDIALDVEAMRKVETVSAATPAAPAA